MWSSSRIFFALAHHSPKSRTFSASQLAPPLFCSGSSLSGKEYIYSASWNKTLHFNFSSSMARTRKLFNCQYCKKVFDRRTRLQRHTDVFHSRCCPLCSSKFTSPDAFETHVLSCKEMELDICEAETTSPSILQQDEDTKTWEALPLPPSPASPFDGLSTSTHADKAAPDVKGVLFRCYICAQETPVMEKIKEHMREVHNTSNLVFNELD